MEEKRNQEPRIKTIKQEVPSFSKRGFLYLDSWLLILLLPSAFNPSFFVVGAGLVLADFYFIITKVIGKS